MKAAAFVFLCLVFGSSWIAIKIGVTHAPPLQASGLRFLLAVVILFAIIRIRRLPLPSTFARAVFIATLGLFMYGLHNALIYSAEQYISSALTSVLFASFPLFVALLSAFVLKEEKVTRLSWLGIVIGFLGVVVISSESLAVSDGLFVGSVLALGGTASAAIGIIMHKKFFSREPIMVAVTLQMAVGAIPLLAGGILWEGHEHLTISAVSVGSIVYLAVFSTALAFLTYYWLLGKTTALVVSMVALVTPVVAIIIGIGFFGEALSRAMVLGTVMIFGGVLAVVKPDRRD